MGLRGLLLPCCGCLLEGAVGDLCSPIGGSLERAVALLRSKPCSAPSVRALEVAVGELLREIPLSERVASAKTPGDRLRVARAASGLTMGQIARMLGETVPQISGDEMGFHPLADARIALLASYYGVSPRWVATGEAADVGDVRGLDGLAPADRDNVLALLRMRGTHE